MTHRKRNHEANVKVCNLFRKGQCTYHECCWFVHRNLEIDKKIHMEIKKITGNHMPVKQQKKKNETQNKILIKLKH